MKNTMRFLPGQRSQAAKTRGGRKSHFRMKYEAREQSGLNHTKVRPWSAYRYQGLL
jgi:hypothetical protein